MLIFYNDREFIVQDINSWVKTFTNGTIKKIVSDNDIKRSTTQALLNTIYLKVGGYIHLIKTKL